jgi:hypothetical protein
MLVVTPYVNHEAAFLLVGPISSDVRRLAFFAPLRVRR